MALWGTSDNLYSTGVVTVNYETKEVTGSGTSFTAVGISTGDVITIGAGGTYGGAVISGITSDTLISIARTESLSGEVIAGVAYSISEKPIYTLRDSNYTSNAVGLVTDTPQHRVYGVDINEAGVAGVSTQYGGFHAGWVGIHTYIDMHGNLRVKSETLVAMSEISSGTLPTYDAPGDAADDDVFADAVITIISQPEDVGIGTTENAVFVVDASIVPSYAPITYQWTEDGSVLSDGGDYSGVTTPILVVQNDNDKAGVGYSVFISSGDVSVVSTAATITYV